MEIRFEAALLDRSFSTSKDCLPGDGECPKQCVQILTIPEILEDKQVSGIDLCTFHHTTGLYKQACGNGYSVVCNPTGTGRLAVLDEDAVDLLEHFRFPASLASLHLEGE